MATAIKVEAEVRSAIGTSAGRRLRRTGKFPGIVYGVGKTPVNVQLDERLFKRALHAHSGENVMLDLDIPGSETKKVLLREVQRHPITGQILHADFNEISLTEKLTIEIALELIGDPAGVTQQGGVLEHLVRTIEVECLPTDIVEEFPLDVSALRIGDSLTAGEIPLDASKYTLITDPELAVVAVAAQRAEEAPAAAAAAATEPEVIKEKKPEGAEAADGAKKDAKAAPAKEAKK